MRGFSVTAELLDQTFAWNELMADNEQQTTDRQRLCSRRSPASLARRTPNNLVIYCFSDK